MKKVCIIIPIHSSYPTVEELISFKKCFDILSKHPIYVIAPNNLDLTVYIKLIPNLKVISINPKWQSSVLNYNKLKLSRYFYSLFNEYEYLLTYELDAFVFKDELLYWCEKGYDYIGAPWFEGYHNANDTSKILGVGNSGFSLRNVQKCIKITSKISRIKFFYGFLTSISLSNSFVVKNIKRLLKICFNLHFGSQSDFVFKDPSTNEDYYWCSLVPSSFVFNIAPIDEAIKFSFEVNSSILYKINDQNLPFGCHAWSKYEPNFWSLHIEH
jgi:hypothetical protein